MDFKEVCNNLDKYCNKCTDQKNKVLCAKNFISCNYTERIDMLQLKAEALNEDYGYYFSLILAEIGIALSIFGILVSIVFGLLRADESISYAMLILFLIMILGGVVFIFVCRFNKIKDWRSYILVALDELLAL
nr:MAG TPA: hypothetical protein [Caudoviricetes sp.]